MKKSTAVALGITAAVAGVGGIAALAANDEEEPTQAAVCVDKSTNQRLDDDQCDDDHYHGGHGWYFIPFGYSAPRVGARVSGGSFNTPQGTSYVTGGVPRAGGAVDSSTVKDGKTTTVRGGFGGSKAGGSGG